MQVSEAPDSSQGAKVPYKIYDEHEAQPQDLVIGA